MSKGGNEPFEILLVEDNPGDVRLTEEALKEADINTRLISVVDGEEALSYLKRQAEYSGARQPDLIFLDLNLPRRNGLEVLEEIKSDEELKYIPVVIITSSEAEHDIVKSYDLHANCYITKPVDFDEFSNVIQSIVKFWFAVVKLPKD